MADRRAHSPAAIFRRSVDGPAIVAHRGFATDVAENTIGSLQRAVAAGADAIEIDVRRTRDGVKVVHHDATVNGLLLSETDFAELPSLGSESIPTLDQMIVAAQLQGAFLDIELKESGYERTVIAAVLDRMSPDEFVITSFNSSTIKAVKAHFPQVSVGLLIGRLRIGAVSVGGIHRFASRVNPAGAIARAKRVGADFVVLHHSLVNARVIEEAHGRAMALVVWTVNDSVGLSQFLADQRIDGIITDHPDRAIALRPGQLSVSEEAVGS